MLQIKGKIEKKRLAVLLACLAVVALIAIVYSLRQGGLGGGVTGAGRLEYAPQDLPKLQMALAEDREAEVGGPGRNPFSFGAPPTATPRPRLPTPTRGPSPTPRPRPSPRMALGADGHPLPPPPPFDRDYLGHFGPVRLQVAAFRRKLPGSDLPEVEVAAAGEVLQDAQGKEIFIVREIGLESVVIGFVGYDRSEDTRVPLAEK
jgi:hypothetical protein